MSSLYLTQPSSCSLFPLKPTLTPSSISKLKPFRLLSKTQKKKKIKRGTCRAEFSPDAPLAAAIGVCMLSSLLFPVTNNGDEDGGGSVVDAGDTRIAVMGVISFIPYFNWLSWVFAWLDTGKRRYAVYSIVYLAPYLRSSLSLSPEDSWLPIASIVFCIVHVQLEASLKNGDIQGFQIFNEAAKRLSSRSKVEDSHFDGHQEPEMRIAEHRNLPDAEKQARNEIRKWGTPRNPDEHHEQLNGDWDDDDDDEVSIRKWSINQLSLIVICFILLWCFFYSWNLCSKLMPNMIHLSKLQKPVLVRLLDRCTWFTYSSDV